MPTIQPEMYAGTRRPGLLAGYRAAIVDSDAAILAVGDPQAHMAEPVDGSG